MDDPQVECEPSVVAGADAVEIARWVALKQAGSGYGEDSVRRPCQHEACRQGQFVGRY